MLRLLPKLCLFLIFAGRLAQACAGEVVLYSSNNVETVNQVVDQFTKQNPDIKVSVAVSYTHLTLPTKA